MFGNTSGKRFIRTNIVASQCGKKILAPMTFKGSCNSELFVAWVEQRLVPALTAGQTVVMDNDSFHKSPKVREAIEPVDCKIV